MDGLKASDVVKRVEEKPIRCCSTLINIQFASGRNCLSAETWLGGDDAWYQLLAKIMHVLPNQKVSKTSSKKCLRITL
jgi:hypothetical protein